MRPKASSSTNIPRRPNHPYHSLNNKPQPPLLRTASQGLGAGPSEAALQAGIAAWALPERVPRRPRMPHAYSAACSQWCLKLFTSLLKRDGPSA